MRSVAQKDTGPEMKLRKMLFRLGYRYRLHRSDLAGKPDIVFPGRNKVIFVHGCFWHGHSCRYGRLPKSRIAYWKRKIAENRRRDRRVLRRLRILGWEAMVVWQCQTKGERRIVARVRSFLGPPGRGRVR
jgi:DNA mismatch endonuclease (patch repair protein)